MSTQHKTIVKKGYDLLKSERYYKQIAVVEKLKFLDFPVNKSSFCNILNGKPTGSDVLRTTAEGIRRLVELELGRQWVDDQFVALDRTDWRPTVVATQAGQTGDPAPAGPAPGFTFHADGRLTIGQKVGFFASAQHEVVEFGLTLNTFASYFFSRNEREFKSPVEELLRQGVHFICYLLDPDSQECRMYFADREKSQPGEINSIERIRESIRKLGRLQEQFGAEGYKGRFEVLLYKHIPYNHFLIVDGETPQARMLVSHYIYGESRANCPVLEFTKKDHPGLYRKYEASFRKFVQDARSIARQG